MHQIILLHDCDWKVESMDPVIRNKAKDWMVFVMLNEIFRIMVRLESIYISGQ